MGDETAYVDHPLWSRFLRWCTIRPKAFDTNVGNPYLVDVLHDNSSRLDSLPNYEYCPLPDPQRDVRLVELLPADFDEDIRIRIHYATLMPPPEGEGMRVTLAEVVKDLPAGWEAFQTVCNLLALPDTIDSRFTRLLTVGTFSEI